MADKPAYLALDSTPAAQVSTLVVDPPYRISLKMGDIEDLFSDNPNTTRGRMTRLQVLGLYYYPIPPAEALGRWFRKSDPARGAIAAFKPCFDWVKEKIFQVNQNSQADEVIQRALTERLVSSAVPPDFQGGQPPADHCPIPESADTPANPTPANFAKIRIPGNFTFMDFPAFLMEKSLSSYLPNSNARKFCNGEILDWEREITQANEALGKIPLVAVVEKKSGDDWVPAEDVSVHFGLVDSYALPAYNAGNPSDQQFSPPPAPAHVTGRIQTNTQQGDNAAGDPRNGNCPAALGGTKGSPISSVFKTTHTPGFTCDHDDRQKPGDKVYFNTGTMTGDTVRVQTNEKGESGVIFLPSRIAGDRFRIRVHVGNPTLTNDGTGVDSVAVETGTFVVWRNVRVSRILQKDVSNTPIASELSNAEFVSGFPVANHSRVANRLCRVPSPSNQFVYPAFPAVEYRDKLAGAYLEVEFDDPVPRAITDDEYKRAVRFVKNSARKKLADLNLPKFDMDKLIPSSWQVKNTLALLAIRPPWDYNDQFWFGDSKKIAMVGPRTVYGPMLQSIRAFIMRVLMPAMMQGLLKNGALPGLSILRSPAFSTWHFTLESNPVKRLGSNGGLLGMGLPVRACYIFQHVGAHGDYQTLLAHENGHNLFRTHASGGGASGANHLRHDIPLNWQTAAHNYNGNPVFPWPGTPPGQFDCMMSYIRTNNHTDAFCTFCNLAMRGWKIETGPAGLGGVSGLLTEFSDVLEELVSVGAEEFEEYQEPLLKVQEYLKKAPELIEKCTSVLSAGSATEGAKVLLAGLVGRYGTEENKDALIRMLKKKAEGSAAYAQLNAVLVRHKDKIDRARKLKDKAAYWKNWYDANLKGKSTEELKAGAWEAAKNDPRLQKFIEENCPAPGPKKLARLASRLKSWADDAPALCEQYLTTAPSSEAVGKAALQLLGKPEVQEVLKKKASAYLARAGKAMAGTPAEKAFLKMKDSKELSSAIASLRAEKVSDLLSVKFWTDKTPEVKKTMVEMMVKHGESSAVSHLQGIALSESDFALRSQLAEQMKSLPLSKIQDKLSLFETLRALATDVNEHVRMNTVPALDKFRNVPGVREVIKGMGKGDPSEAVRGAVNEAMKKWL